jgi:hypothetical protein
VDRIAVNRIAPDSTVRLFWAFVAAHVAAWTLVPALTQPNAPLDAIEMLYWGHEWQWGYFKHPPLPAWIAETCWLVCGSVDWPLYLVSQVCVAACLWAAWQMARDTLPPWPALTAALLLETSFYFTFTTPEFNNNLPAKAGWALATLAVWRGLVRSDWRWWAGAGAAFGVALLSKYDGLVLLASILGFLVVHPRARSAWKTPGPWAMLAVTALVVAPHVMWLVAHDAPTLTYVRHRAAPDGQWLDHLENPLWFLLAQLPALVGILALGATVVRSGWPLATGPDLRRLQRDYLVAAVLGPPLCTAAAAALTGLEPRTMWGAAMWTHAGVLLLVTFATVEAELPFRRLVGWCAVAGVLMLAAFTGRTLGHAAVTGRPARVHFPGRELAAAVEERWQEVTDEPLEVIGGEWWAAGNAAFYHPERPDVFPEMRSEQAPWTSDAVLRHEGGVIIWPLGDDDYDDEVEAWLRRFPGARSGAPIELAARTVPVTKPLTFGVAIVPPDGAVPLSASGAGCADQDVRGR